MKKLTVLSTVTLSVFILAGCSQMKRQMKKDPSRELSSLIDTVDLEDDDVLEKNPRTGEYTHEMAEANADDIEIKQEVGDAEIDAELPGSDKNEVPYSRDFLLKKNTRRMQFWVDYFTKKQRERFQRFINNGEEYRHHIEKIFMEHGLPKELYYVGLIESGYYLGARSHASAVGPWQFIKGTGKRYNLTISHEIDERQDLFKATRAAAQYFKDLHNIFSSWELALAAYNAGEYGIIRRIVKHGTRDFYQLSRNKQLPSETINYVPKVLAAMHVVNNAEKYGFDIPRKKNHFFDLTELKPIKKNVSLSTIARRLNVSVKLLKKLNPELKRNATPRRFAGTYYLRVPQSKYSYNLEDLEVSKIAARTKVRITRPETRKEISRRTASTRPRYHRVKRGETLISISRKYDTTPGKLAVMNGFKSWRTRVKIGQRLTIVEAEERVARKPATPKVKKTNRPIVYKVARGDNLTELARLFNTSLNRLKKANNLKRGKILVGQKIVLPNTQKGIYTVKPGDHLTKVAKDFNLPLEALIKINALKRKTIYPGQKIIVNMD